MIAELVAVGTEILLGNIVNTNSAYLSEQMAQLGLSVYYETVVGDNHDRMKAVIASALDRSDVVILSGGLGPTEDDLTKEVCAEVMGLPLEEDPHSRKRIERYMKEYEKNHPDRRITTNNYKQAQVPKGALVIDNHNGTAKGEDEKECKKLIKPVVRELKRRFGKNIFALEAEKTLEESVVDMLRDQGLTLALAESCTGGAIAARIVNVPGASQVFTHGFVTYSNRAKRKCLGVKKSTLKTEGAVSAKCAKEMAKGGCANSDADICLSITGLAGPDGGTKETPVGTVFMGCCYNGQTITREYHFTGNRTKIRQQAVASALVLLRECIMEGIEKND